jgi:hypothetical protein
MGGSTPYCTTPALADKPSEPHAPSSISRLGTPGSALKHRPNATTAEFWLLRAAKAEVRVSAAC